MPHITRTSSASPIQLEISSAEMYATAWKGERAVATLQRRRVYETGPAWKCYDTDGALLFSSHIGSASYLARRIERALFVKAQLEAPKGWAFAETSVEA